MLINKTTNVRWALGYFCLLTLLILACASAARPQTTSFTYQGRLMRRRYAGQRHI